MAASSYPGLFSFYWIDQCGLTRFRWYADNQEAEARQDKDDLLSGFLSAIMNFSREMFKGEELAHLEMYNYRVFFRTLPRKDIFVLVTTMTFEEARAKIILSHVINEIGKTEIPEMSCRVGESDWLLPILLEGIESAQPKSLAAVLEPFIQKACAQSLCVGYLVKEYGNTPPLMKINDCAEFEFTTFLESVFWEKISTVMGEQTALAAKVFELGKVSHVKMDLGIGVLTNFYHPKGFFSIAYTKEIQEAEIQPYIHDVVSKLEQYH